MIGSLVISLKPQWAAIIYSGKKTIEWRKSMPVRAHRWDRVYIYETAPIKAITGYFTFSSSFKFDCDAVENYPGAIERGCVPLEDLKKYQGNAEYIYGWFVKNPVRYEDPHLLSHFGIKQAPQSWQYVGTSV